MELFDAAFQVNVLNVSAIGYNAKTDFYFKSAARGVHLAEFWRIARNRMVLREIFFYLLMEKSLP